MRFAKTIFIAALLWLTIAGHAQAADNIHFEENFDGATYTNASGMEHDKLNFLLGRVVQATTVQNPDASKTDHVLKNEVHAGNGQIRMQALSSSGETVTNVFPTYNTGVQIWEADLYIPTNAFPNENCAIRTYVDTNMSATKISLPLHLRSYGYASAMGGHETKRYPLNQWFTIQFVSDFDNNWFETRLICDGVIRIQQRQTMRAELAANGMQGFTIEMMGPCPGFTYYVDNIRYYEQTSVPVPMGTSFQEDFNDPYTCYNNTASGQLSIVRNGASVETAAGSDPSLRCSVDSAGGSFRIGNLFALPKVNRGVQIYEIKLTVPEQSFAASGDAFSFQLRAGNSAIGTDMLGAAAYDLPRDNPVIVQLALNYNTKTYDVNYIIDGIMEKRALAQPLPLDFLQYGAASFQIAGSSAIAGSQLYIDDIRFYEYDPLPLRMRSTSISGIAYRAEGGTVTSDHSGFYAHLPAGETLRLSSANPFTNVTEGLFSAKVVIHMPDTAAYAVSATAISGGKEVPLGTGVLSGALDYTLDLTALLDTGVYSCSINESTFAQGELACSSIENLILSVQNANAALVSFHISQFDMGAFCADMHTYITNAAVQTGITYNNRLADNTISQFFMEFDGNTLVGLQKNNLPTGAGFIEYKDVSPYTVKSCLLEMRQLYPLSENILPKPAPKQYLYYTRPAQETLLDALNTAHPRVIGNSSNFDRIREYLNTDPYINTWYGQFKAQADNAINPAHSSYNKTFTYDLNSSNGYRLNIIASEMFSYIENLALAYQIESDPEKKSAYAARAYRVLENGMDFPDWHPDHFLDCAGMMMAFSVGYDWFYDAWTDAQRETLKTCIIERGLIPALEAYTQTAQVTDSHWQLSTRQGWTYSNTNWNPYCNAAVIMAAAAIADEEPALCETLIWNALRSLEFFLPSYAPDGGSEEGIGYGLMAMDAFTAGMSTLNAALGTDFGYFDVPGLYEFVYYPPYLNGPAAAFNFHDGASERKQFMPATFYFATRFQQPELCAMRLNDFNMNGAAATINDLLWYDPSMQYASLDALPLDRYFRGVETGSFRSSWEDPNALYLGFHGGENDVSHTHLDAGSFIIDALGERWACDLGADTLTYFGDSTQFKRYDLYRLKAEGHNTLYLNPSKEQDQALPAWNPVTKFCSEQAYGFAIMDLTNAYKKDAISAQRGFKLCGNRSKIVIQDEVTLAAPGELWWGMHTKASIMLSDDCKTAYLTINGKTLKATLASSEGSFSVRPAKPLPESPTVEGQADNSGVQKLCIHLSSVQKTTICVEFSADMNSVPEKVLPLSAWN